jgi:hypothetical protein
MHTAPAFSLASPARPPKPRKKSRTWRKDADFFRSSTRGPILALALTALAGVAYATFRLDTYAQAFARRGKEAELLLYGRAYMHAIENFYQAVPGAGARYPQTFEELISDPRLAGRRHLRRLYKDPMTGADFLPVRNETGGITGVVSASAARPVRKQGFELELAGFDDAPTYRDWLFDASGTQPWTAGKGTTLAAAAPPAAPKTALASR